VPADGLASLPQLSQEALAAVAAKPCFAVPGALCEKLVVPRGAEYVFAIPELLESHRQQLSFSVLSLAGKALCSVYVRELSDFQRVIDVKFLNGKQLARVCLATDLREAKVFRPDANGGDAVDECFATIALEESKEENAKSFGRRFLVRASAPNFNLKGGSGGGGDLLLAFDGAFPEKAINGVAPTGVLLCATRRRQLDEALLPSSAGSRRCYEVRVASGADAALILCGLLAIDKLGLAAPGK